MRRPQIPHSIFILLSIVLSECIHNIWLFKLCGENLLPHNLHSIFYFINSSLVEWLALMCCPNMSGCINFEQHSHRIYNFYLYSSFIFLCIQALWYLRSEGNISIWQISHLTSKTDALSPGLCLVIICLCKEPGCNSFPQRWQFGFILWICPLCV